MTCIHPTPRDEIFCSLCGVRVQDKPGVVKTSTASETYQHGLIYLANAQFDDALIKFKSAALSPSLGIKSLQMVIYTLFCKGLDDTLKPQFLYQCEKLKKAYSQDGKEEKEIREIMASAYSSAQLEKVIKGRIPLEGFFEKCKQQIQDIPERAEKFFFCNNCGWENQPDNYFCPNCGMSLKPVEVEKPQLEPDKEAGIEIPLPGRQTFIQEKDSQKSPIQWYKIAIIGCLGLLLALPAFYYYLDPKWDAYWSNRAGEKAFKEGKYTDANVAFKQAIKLNPGHVRYQANLAAVLLKSGNLTEAAKQFKKVLSLDPDNKEARSQFGVLLQEDGILVDQWYQQALKLFNSNQFLKTQETLEQGETLGYKHPDASKLLACLQKKKYLCLLHCAKAQKKLDSGEITSANHHIKQAICFYPDEPEVERIQAEIQGFIQKFGSQTITSANIFGLIEAGKKNSRQIVKVVKTTSPEAMCGIMGGAMDYPDYSHNKLACWLKELKKKGYSYKKRELSTTTVVTIFKRE